MSDTDQVMMPAQTVISRMRSCREAYRTAVKAASWWSWAQKKMLYGAIAAISIEISELETLTAQAIEARRAETGTGSVHESAVPEGGAS